MSWHPFQLNPDLPREGIDRRAVPRGEIRRARSAPRRSTRGCARSGRPVGIDFAFDRIERQPNTLDAHRLISWAQAQGDADEVVERLFRAYFLEGRLIGDRDVLAAIAGEAGPVGARPRAPTCDGEGVDTIAAMDRRVRELGVTGVPFFIFDGKVAVSGAQEPDTLVAAMLQAIRDTGG